MLMHMVPMVCLYSWPTYLLVHLRTGILAQHMVNVQHVHRTHQCSTPVTLKVELLNWCARRRSCHAQLHQRQKNPQQ
jgi:hypothetical protein